MVWRNAASNGLTSNCLICNKKLQVSGLVHCWQGLFLWRQVALGFGPNENHVLSGPASGLWSRLVVDTSRTLPCNGRCEPRKNRGFSWVGWCWMMLDAFWSVSSSCAYQTPFHETGWFGMHDYCIAYRQPLATARLAATVLNMDQIRVDASFSPLFALVCITMSLKITSIVDDGMLAVL